MIYKYLIIGLVLILSSCGNKGRTTESKQLYDKVMEVHDEVMPKMRDLRTKSKSLKNLSHYEDNKTAQDAVIALDDAQESMMDWMAQFKMPKEASNEEEMTFLKGQWTSVNAMKNTMLTALSNAEKILSENEKQ